MEQLKPGDLEVDLLGEPHYDSPVRLNSYIGEKERFLFDINPDAVLKKFEANEQICTIERGGPRRKIFFHPETTRAAIVTCGGLCPGINNVIRSITLELLYQYGIASVIGYRYGYKGMADPSIEPRVLNSETTNGISELGGSILASSRGPQEVDKMIDRLESDGINLLFVIGGDGSLKGALALQQRIAERGLKIAIIGIPKTIDNDLNFISKSFGFQTAYSKAVEAIRCAHTESLGTPNGVGVVKVMGRHSGAIACHATLASQVVNFCLIPEIDFQVSNLLEGLVQRLKKRSHAVIVIAEGVAQDLSNRENRRDASGNLILSDSGVWLKKEIAQYLDRQGIEHNIKYIDPSYIIRSVPASPEDALFCNMVGQYAVHAGMSGRTAVVIGQWNHYFGNIPIRLVVRNRKLVNVNGTIWRSVQESTGQNF